MKQSESYYSFFVVGLCFLLLPFLNIAMGSLWWGFGYVPFMPIFLLVAFFVLPQSQYLFTIILGGWWYDLMVGSAGPSALLAVVFSSMLLYGVSQVISSRSLLSDLIVAVLLYVVWITVAFVVNLVMQKITPSSPIVSIDSVVLFIGFISVVFMQLFSRHYILRDNVVPKALS
jgi:hypothetical protein